MATWSGRRLAATLCLLLLAASATMSHGAPRAAPGTTFQRESPFVVRPFRPFIGPRWIGDAVAYGPHRDGQRPGGPAPSREQLREDLQLIAKRWPMLRVYGSDATTDTMLQVIREDGLALRVMLGVWLAPEEHRDSTRRVIETLDEARAANRQQIEAGIRLADAYPDIVRAIIAGNETQVSWSAHRFPAATLIRAVRELRARTRVPITTADDFAWWLGPESRVVAREVDFVLTHMHPLWNGRLLEDAVPWTRTTFEKVRAAHPDRWVAIGETGWATDRRHEGEQGRLIHGEVGEQPQAVYLEALRAWTRRDSVTTFVFEAFDENWKGGPEPDEVEKHWGLYHADRTPKSALRKED